MGLSSQYVQSQPLRAWKLGLTTSQGVSSWDAYTTQGWTQLSTHVPQILDPNLMIVNHILMAS